MGLLAALNLPPSRSMAATPPKAPPLPKGRPSTKKAPAHTQPAKPDTPHAAVPAQDPVAASAEAAPMAAPPAEAPAKTASTPVGTEVGIGDGSVSIKQTDKGFTVVAKYEKKIPGPSTNFSVYGVPFYVKADLKIGIEGSGDLTESTPKLSIGVKGAGALELGLGGTSPVVTAGPYGVAELSAGRTIELSSKGVDEFAVEPFRFDVRGSGKVGIKFELDKSWSMNKDADLVDWHLLIVHVDGWSNAGWGRVWAEPGKDMQRLIAAMQQAGPAIADAVEKYAPDKVKKAAEDGAKWAAESDDAKKIADTTEAVLDKVEQKTGADIGGGAEKVVQVLVDPGGETADEATARVNRESAILNASSEDFHNVMVSAGLFEGGPLASVTGADKQDYNSIVAVKQAEDELLRNGGVAPGAWRPMVVELVAKRTKDRKQRLAAAAAKKKAETDAVAMAAAADLAARVKFAEDQLASAFTAAQMSGNPLNNDARSTPGSKARMFWETGMTKFYNPAVVARQQMASLQGEARIATATQAAMLFRQAAQEFQQGLNARA